MLVAVAVSGSGNRVMTSGALISNNIDKFAIGQRSATLVVAANNSSQKSKDGADFVVPGGADNVQNTINGNNIKICNLMIDGNKDVIPSSARVVSLERVENIIVRNIKIINAKKQWYCYC